MQMKEKEMQGGFKISLRGPRYGKILLRSSASKELWKREKEEENVLWKWDVGVCGIRNDKLVWDVFFYFFLAL